MAPLIIIMWFVFCYLFRDNEAIAWAGAFSLMFLIIGGVVTLLEFLGIM